MELHYIACPHRASVAKKGSSLVHGLSAVASYGTPPVSMLLAEMPVVADMRVLRRFLYDAVPVGGVVFGGLWVLKSKVFEGKTVSKSGRPA